MSVLPLKLQPLRNREGLERVTSPSKEEDGPIVRLPAPLKVRFCAVGPVCLNARRYKVPAEKPPAPIVRSFVAASVQVAVAFPPNITPCPLLEETTILWLNKVPAEF